MDDVSRQILFQRGRVRVRVHRVRVRVHTGQTHGNRQKMITFKIFVF